MEGGNGAGEKARLDLVAELQLAREFLSGDFLRFGGGLMPKDCVEGFVEVVANRIELKSPKVWCITAVDGAVGDSLHGETKGIKGTVGLPEEKIDRATTDDDDDEKKRTYAEEKVRRFEIVDALLRGACRECEVGVGKRKGFLPLILRKRLEGEIDGEGGLGGQGEKGGEGVFGDERVCVGDGDAYEKDVFGGIDLSETGRGGRRQIDGFARERTCVACE